MEDEVTSLPCRISWLPQFLSFAKLVEQWVGIWVEKWLEITWDVSTTFSFLASFGLCLKKRCPDKKNYQWKIFCTKPKISHHRPFFSTIKYHKKISSITIPAFTGLSTNHCLWHYHHHQFHKDRDQQTKKLSHLATSFRRALAYSLSTSPLSFTYFAYLNNLLVCDLWLCIAIYISGTHPPPSSSVPRLTWATTPSYRSHRSEPQRPTTAADITRG